MKNECICHNIKINVVCSTYASEGEATTTSGVSTSNNIYCSGDVGAYGGDVGAY